MVHKDTKIGILGDGGWGTALAIGLAQNGFKPFLWGAFPSYVEEMKKKRENFKFLAGFEIPGDVQLNSDIQDVCRKADWIILAIPSQYMRSVLRKFKQTDLRSKKFVTVAKGIETSTLKVMSEVIREELGSVKLCVLSGPSIAREVAARMPVCLVAASADKKIATDTRKIFSSEHISVFETEDVLGVELGGSIKNVIAIGAGIVEGQGYGSNTRAAVFTRGIAEIARLGRKMGAKRETFMGLSGLGDLATTCLSVHSRNRWLGEEIGKGKALKQVLSKTEMVVEGVETCRSAKALAKKYKISMPITEAVYSILFRKVHPRNLVKAIMQDKSYQEAD